MALSKITNLSITDDAVRTVGIQDAAVTTAKTSGVPTLFLPTANPLIINGNMQVAQRGTSTASLTSSSYNTVDRFKTNISGLGTWTETQESLTSDDAFADGFSNALKIDCTTADASPAVSDRLYWSYRFEGQDVQVLKKGTANAEKVTIAFWVKATKTGTNILELYDNDNGRAVSTAYTVSSTDTWEYKVVNFPADTTGALGDDNGGSLYLFWYLGAGTNYTSGTLQTTWATSVNANRVVGQVNHGDSTSNNVHITGVQMQVGEYTSSDLPPFRHESYGANLSRCLRYAYQAIQGTGEELSGGWYYSTSHVSWMMVFPVPMRVKPSLTASDASNHWVIYRDGAADYFESIHLENTDNLFDKVSMYNSSDVSGTAGDAGIVRSYSASSSALYDAEL